MSVVNYIVSQSTDGLDELPTRYLPTKSKALLKLCKLITKTYKSKEKENSFCPRL